MCCMCTLACIEMWNWIFGLNMKDSCLKCRKIDIIILYGIYMIKCDVIDDDIIAFDDRY